MPNRDKLIRSHTATAPAARTSYEGDPATRRGHEIVSQPANLAAAERTILAGIKATDQREQAATQQDSSRRKQVGRGIGRVGLVKGVGATLAVAATVAAAPAIQSSAGTILDKLKSVTPDLTDPSLTAEQMEVQNRALVAKANAMKDDQDVADAYQPPATTYSWESADGTEQRFFKINPDLPAEDAEASGPVVGYDAVDTVMAITDDLNTVADKAYLDMHPELNIEPKDPSKLPYKVDPDGTFPEEIVPPQTDNPEQPPIPSPQAERS